MLNIYFNAISKCLKALLLSQTLPRCCTRDLFCLFFCFFPQVETSKSWVEGKQGRKLEGGWLGVDATKCFPVNKASTW